MALAACGARVVAGPPIVDPSYSASPRTSPSIEATPAEANVAAPTHQEVDLDSLAGELPPAAPERAPHPLAALSNAEVEALVVSESPSLGPASLGKTNRGALYDGIQMQSRDGWHVVNPRETWATRETIKYLSHTIARVRKMIPNTPVINIGDISRHEGGHIAPHVSHQAGRDVDLGFYYLDNSAWYSKANTRNLDVPRTWALVKVTVTETDVEAIFLDRSIQKILRSYATSIGESEEWLDQVFGGPSSSLRPLIIHEEGHKTHLHIRYYNPIAQETGRRIYRALLKHKLIKPPTFYKKYKARRGDSLIRIAKKNKTDVKALRRANGLRSNRIFAGRTYKIPKKGGVVQPGKLVLPLRRVPSRLAKLPIVAPTTVSDAANEPVSNTPAANAADATTPVASTSGAAPNSVSGAETHNATAP